MSEKECEMPEMEKYPKGQPPQSQEKQPGVESVMTPRPFSEMRDYIASGKLKNKIALVTGGDSGIGRAVAIGFAKEGANIAIVYLNEHEDARETSKFILEEGRKCILIPGNVGDESFCIHSVEKTVAEFGTIDILVNNAAEQHETESIEELSTQQFTRTFQTNIFAYFFMSKAALKYMKEGSCIVNTSSITAYAGHPTLLDYASTKGAIVSFTRSLALSLAERGIRVNAVAPGPIWTPLIPASFKPEKVAKFGTGTALGRAGQPDEVAPSYIFLASRDSSYMTGQVLHPNGGRIVNG
jgi:NAD(P)-dependent dehydrogenase (short-subunit alcohol dehydrogenase family)